MMWLERLILFSLITKPTVMRAKYGKDVEMGYSIYNIALELLGFCPQCILAVDLAHFRQMFLQLS